MVGLARELGMLLPRKLIYGDVGARWGLADPWKPFRPILQVVSFEPDAEEHRKLLAAKVDGDVVLNNALHRTTGNRSLHLTRSRGCSSLYEPNREFLDRFAEPERYDVERTEEIKTVSLDELHSQGALPDLDFLKLDVQGAELDVLHGGEKLISEKCAGLEIEVEFQPLYRSQPLFGDIDAFVRSRLGMELQDLRKTYWKRPSASRLASWKGQLVFGDALYLRPPETLLKWSKRFTWEDASAKLANACAMALAYGYPDYALSVLEQPGLEDRLSLEKVRRFKELVTGFGKGIRIDLPGSRLVFELFSLLARIFQRSHGGWAAIGHRLGSKKRFGVFT